MHVRHEVASRLGPVFSFCTIAYHRLVCKFQRCEVFVYETKYLHLVVVVVVVVAVLIIV